MSKRDEKPDRDFDPTAELWDRIIDDVIQRGSPCLETVEQLVDEACHRPARLEKEAGDEG